MEVIIFKIVLAVIIGGIIGAERELRTGFGMRTMMLICLGATLFTIYSDYFAVDQGDPRRIAAAVVTGVGFLGAGMILRHQGGVYGLTTAATVWLVAALGMGIGIEKYLLVGVATILVLIVLWAIPLLMQLANAGETLSYEVLIASAEPQHEELLAVLQDNKLKVSKSTMSKSAAGVNYMWRAYGKSDDHQAAMLLLMDRQEIAELRVV